jgi:recombinational DNA repair protein (RecF pathway)
MNVINCKFYVNIAGESWLEAHTPKILIFLCAIMHRALCLEGDKYNFLHCVLSHRTVSHPLPVCSSSRNGTMNMFRFILH